MPKIVYVEKDFQRSSRKIIRAAEEIIDEYTEQGFRLTLRQLYYQFVARGLLPNTMQSYKRLGSIVNNARLAGLIDWSAIEDRTRNLRGNSHWASPKQILSSCVESFQLDKWEGQPNRLEVWIEKEALAGVFEGVCTENDVPFFSCRGYTSQSEMWVAAMRLRHYVSMGQTPVILHFGDHDPSGIDMTRDVIDRMETFGLRLDVRRLALNMDQVDEHQPPPNPAKVTDSRFDGYMDRYGSDSWELDALEPALLSELAADTIQEYRDQNLWDARVAEEVEHVRKLEAVRDGWSGLTEGL